MYRILTASKDTYITNKILNNKFRVEDSNVGAASTLDLFKLYAESTSGSNKTPIELSRALVKFDIGALRLLTGSSLDINNSSFKCTLKLHDVYGGQPTPSNFKLIVFPLSKSFDEGIGRDVILFQDLDVANFLTASVTDGSSISKWNISGANKQGFLGSSNIDIISSGTLSGSASTSNIDLWVQQTFKTGREDLSVDVTKIISGTLKGLIPDHGFRISFSGTQETDQVTRFVKRFGSRHCTNPSLRPKLVVTYNDSIQDHHESFYFNLSGSLFLNNFHRGDPANILSGASATSVGGENCMIVKLISGSTGRSTYFFKALTASQHTGSSTKAGMPGVYSASFAVSEFSSGTLRKEIKNAGSATFTEIWGSKDGTVGYYSGSLVIKSITRTSFDNQPRRVVIAVTNIQAEYRCNEKIKLRVFVTNIGKAIRAKKLPYENVSEIYTRMYYRVRDFVSDDIIIPFETKSNGTLLSTDSKGMYFEMYTDSFVRGRVYTLDFMIKDSGFDQVFTNIAAKFRAV